LRILTVVLLTGRALKVRRRAPLHRGPGRERRSGPCDPGVLPGRAHALAPAPV